MLGLFFNRYFRFNAERLVTHLVDSDRHDEIGQLAQALNHSLDRIDQSLLINFKTCYMI